jgi:AraC-like DNA-binding protein
MLRFPDVPRYLIGYATVLGFNSCLYMWINLHFTILGFEIWLIVFTLANLYICFRTLETLALSLPMPTIVEVDSAPEVEQIEQTDREDFNEANHQRFERVDFWMQHHREDWKESSFGRDQLCEGVGINRHLILQCVRSQGYYSIHEYINTYRIAELKRMIARGEAHNLRECLDAGFGTLKTARSSFEKVTGMTLDQAFEQVQHKS